jgi:hypothetical protein
MCPRVRCPAALRRSSMNDDARNSAVAAPDENLVQDEVGSLASACLEVVVGEQTTVGQGDVRSCGRTPASMPPRRAL